MKILVPLYIYPIKDGNLAPEWQAIKDARDSGIPVVAVANPGSGPGTDADRPSYELGMQALRDSGVEVVGYVPSGYGRVLDEQVKGNVSLYKEWYGQWVSGIFLDETSQNADEVLEGDRGMCKKYKGYHTYIKEQFGPSATVICNTGTLLTDETLIRTAGEDIIWNIMENSRSYMEKHFGECTFGKPKPRRRKSTPVTGTPPAAPTYVQGRAAFMVHGAARLSPEELRHWVFQLRDGGWTHVYMTDYFFDPESDNPALLNPWNGLPKYWDEFVRAVEAVREDDLTDRR